MFGFSRKGFFRLFALFFVVISPFLVVYSLGYNINLAERRLSNTLSVQVETFPIGAEVYNQNAKLDGLTPTDIRTLDGKVLNLGIRKEGFVAEEFLVWGAEEQNTAARITNLWLLPNKGTSLASINRPEFKQNLSILDDAVFWRESGNQSFWVQDYTITGFQSIPQQVSAITKTKPFYENIVWQNVGGRTWFDADNNLALFKNQQTWQLLDLSEDFIFGNPESSINNPNKNAKVAQVVRSGNDQLLVLNEAQELWLFDIINQKWDFLENDVTGLYYSPSLESIWIWQKAKIFRLNLGGLDSLNLDNFVFSENLELVSFLDICDRTCILEVKNSFQGILFRINNNIWLVSDYNRSTWEPLADNVQATSSNQETLFWLDTKNQIVAWNFLFAKQYLLGELGDVDTRTQIRLHYDYNWRRLLIYSDNQISSVWYDPSQTNNEIIKFSLQPWIKNSACVPRIIERLQFCLAEGKLVVYKSTSLI